MGKTKWEVEFYEKRNGKCPTDEFLSEISKRDKKDLVFINRAFSRLEQLGPRLRRPHAGFLRDEIHELRVRTHHGLYRLLYFFFDSRNRIIIVTHGITKQSKDVPDSEIDRAIEYRKDYLTRKSKGKRK